MLVSGLWHGAAFNFILWGAWHAGLLILHRVWTSTPFAQRTTTYPRVWSWFSWVTTYILVNLGWAFFVMDSSTALLFFKRLIAG
jgi:alginate O-acetyltransferase complex protein AlgI